MSSTAEQRRGPWSRSEDERLKQLVDLRGPTNWVAIANELGTRSAKQCRERYHQNLKQSLDHTPIRPDEGVLINTMVNQIGKRWAEIARHLHNRCDNTVKNWWNGGQNRRIRKDRRRVSRQLERQDEGEQVRVDSRSYSSPGQHHSSVYLPGSQRAYSPSTVAVPYPPSITSPRLYALRHRQTSSSSRSLPHSYPQRRLVPGRGLPSPSTASASSTAADHGRPPTHSPTVRSSGLLHYGSNHILPLTPGSCSSGPSSPMMPPLPPSSLLCDYGIRLPPIGQHGDERSESSTVPRPRQLPPRTFTLNPVIPIYTGYESEMSPTTVSHGSRHVPWKREGSIYENTSPTYESGPPTYPTQPATSEASEYTHVSSSETGTFLCDIRYDTHVPRTVTHETGTSISERPTGRARRKMKVEDLLWNAGPAN
ncbi:hypothetical protein F4818DRAFT_189495 [Hypoxylon cercidicola]|nr:hypothetical protein F4818DRAFT_189495 [Hypoxylon cercidicola]